MESKEQVRVPAVPDFEALEEDDVNALGKLTDPGKSTDSRDDRSRYGSRYTSRNYPEDRQRGTRSNYRSSREDPSDYRNGGVDSNGSRDKTNEGER